MSERCRRFEEEALPLLERSESEGGPALDEHFSTCADCLQAATEYQGLIRRLQAPEGSGPPADWQARVWSGIARRRAAKRRRLLWRIGTAAAFSVLVAIMATRWSPEGPTPADGGLGSGEVTAPFLEFDLMDGDEVRRGEDPKPGDRLFLRAWLKSPDESVGRLARPKASDVSPEIRVYFNDRELVLRCRPDRAAESRGADDSICRRIPGGVEAELVLGARGRYQPMAIRHVTQPGAAPVDALSGGLDGDSSLLLRAGAHLFLASEFEVR